MLEKNIEKDIQTYSKLVYRIAFIMLNDKSDADDIFQEVFIKLYKQNNNFTNEEHKKAWLIKVTTNECRSLLRKSWFKNRNELDENIISPEVEGREVFYIVEELAEKYRIVILLYYYERYKENEIAQILNLSEGTIKSRLHRARELLKKKIQGGFENE